MRPVLIGKLSKIILVKWWSIKNLNAKIQGGWPTCPGLSRSLLILTLKSPTSWGTFLSPKQFRTVGHPGFRMDADKWEITEVREERGKATQGWATVWAKAQRIFIPLGLYFQPLHSPPISQSLALAPRVLREEGSALELLHATWWCTHAHRSQQGPGGTSDQGNTNIWTAAGFKHTFPQHLQLLTPELQ